MTQHTPSSPRLRPIIRVFVSSTFSDMKHERNALAVEVYPKLEKLCQDHGFHFQAIDLRWGVSTEAGLDHRTMRICFEELRRAQEISPEPNFLILLGDRYGWRPLPESISAQEFGALKEAATTKATNEKHVVGQRLDPLAVLKNWYRCDENILMTEPPEIDPDRVPLNYILQPRQNLGDGRDYTRTKDGQDTQDWLDVQQVLWSLINTAFPVEGRWFDGMDWGQHVGEVNDPQHPKRAIPRIARFQASATEQEIWCGALSAANAERHVIACFREIANRGELTAAEVKDFFDRTDSGEFDPAAAARQTALKEAIRLRLGKNEPLRIPFSRLKRENDGILLEASEADTKVFCDAVFEQFRPIIERQIEEYWNKSKQGSPERAARELKIEQDEHQLLGRERGGKETFVGREVELKAIRAYLQNASGQPLVVHGSSGCGKTALMWRAFEEIPATQRPLIRLIGTTPHSSDLRGLLTSLCQELRQRTPREGALPTDIKELRDEFDQHLRAATTEQPLILFLDALDQLSDADGGRLLTWIPLGQLPPHVKLVVSCLSDRAKEDAAGQPYAELQKRQLPAGNIIDLEALSEAEAKALLFDRWLHQAGRIVSQGQRKTIEQRLTLRACRQPIYLKLLFEEARLWRSYDKAPRLGEDVPAILKQLFDRLSHPANHGPLLVERVLGYLTASRHGLAENEILEILFADPEYKKGLHTASVTNQHELPASATRIPIAIWSRLRFDLAPYLTERAAPGANVLTFYHRQVAKSVMEHFSKPSAQGWQAHQRLGDYFTTCCKTPASNYLPQERAIGEVAYHFRMCGNKERLRAIYSAVSYYCSYVTCHNAFGLKDEMQLVPEDCVPVEIGLFIENAAALLAKHPGQAPQLMYKELVSNVYRREAESLAVRPWIRADRIQIEQTAVADGSSLAPSVSTKMDIEAYAVADLGGIAFVHNSANRIELLRMDDLKPCGEIALPPHGTTAIRMLLCDRFGRMLAWVYDSGELEIHKLKFSPSRTLLSTTCLHRDTCMKVKFGAMSAYAWPDGIVYQSLAYKVVHIAIDSTGQVMTEQMDIGAATLTNCLAGNIPSLARRDDQGYAITFPGTPGVIRTGSRVLTLCQYGCQLAIATEAGNISLHHWPSLALEQNIPTRRTILSISHTEDGQLVMTDRYANIISLDPSGVWADHGRCSQSEEDYPSALFAMGKRVFYISNRRCAILSRGGENQREIMQVDDEGGIRGILMYSRAKGFTLTTEKSAPRTLQQSIVGQIYDFEFSKFKWARSLTGAVAYTRTDRQITIETEGRIAHHTIESGIHTILSTARPDAFLVFSSSGILSLVTVDQVQSLHVDVATSSSDHYRILNCGEYLCVVSYWVLRNPRLRTAFTETVLGLYQLSFTESSADLKPIEIQNIDNFKPEIRHLAYNRSSNCLYLDRVGTLQQWQLDDPCKHHIAYTEPPQDRNTNYPLCACKNGVIYVDISDQLKYYPIDVTMPGAVLASYRAVTHLSLSMDPYGYLVENSQQIFRINLEE
jgi:hypothetical protein